jgi:hypothetical protein
MAVYIPGKGDFIAVTFDPQSGHEQKGGVVIGGFELRSPVLYWRALAAIFMKE